MGLRQKDRTIQLASAFSRRLPLDLNPHELDQRLTQLVERDGCVDLMQANPTRCGFAYPDITAPLMGGAALPYAPDPRGTLAARQAVASYLSATGHDVSPQHVVLTASTSEAYGFLFKLFCDPGDAVAASAPTYPLVQHLAELDGVVVSTYALHYGQRWELDLDGLAGIMNQGVKALVVISPNNPTGACLNAEQGAALAALSRRHGVPLIVDEVFAPYRHTSGPPPFELLAEAPLWVSLGGLSKAAGAPQLKLAWMTVHGDAPVVQAAMARLEWIADAYLSVSTPVQQALPALLKAAPALQMQMRQRVQQNRATLAAALQAVPAVSLLTSEGGWYAVLQVPQSHSEDEWVMGLATKAACLVHPGYFYDFPRRGFLVVGLLVDATTFAAAVHRMIAAFQAALT